MFGIYVFMRALRGGVLLQSLSNKESTRYAFSCALGEVPALSDFWCCKKARCFKIAIFNRKQLGVQGFACCLVTRCHMLIINTCFC